MAQEWDSVHVLQNVLQNVLRKHRFILSHISIIICKSDI